MKMYVEKTEINWKRRWLIMMLTWIWSLFPAVIFEIVQHVSLRIDSFEAVSKVWRHGNTEQLIIIWVCESSPVTILPTARNAAETTECWWCLNEEKKVRYKNWIFIG